MPMVREVIAIEIARAELELKNYATQLEGQKVAKKDFKKNTVFRSLEGGLRQWRRRFNALERMVAVNADVAARKAGGGDVVAAAPVSKAGKASKAK